MYSLTEIQEWAERHEYHLIPAGFSNFRRMSLELVSTDKNITISVNLWTLKISYNIQYNVIDLESKEYFDSLYQQVLTDIADFANTFNIKK